MRNNNQRKILAAVTGASGMIFLKAFIGQCRLVENLVIHGICSEAGQEVMRVEIGREPQDLEGVEEWFDYKEFGAPPASGSSSYDAMVVLPCSMGTLGAIAGGISGNLIHRSSDVMIKEKKKLVLAIRETPLNRIHMENMLRAHDSGAVICPIMPGYYFQPQNLEEVADSFAWRLMDQLGILPAERKRWDTHG
jgi:4-hydroxy-3-polyprenylbenzoate decarboxylase